MAKVMISLPDDLLERFDIHARRRGTTRSGLLRELAQHELAASSDARRRRIDELLAMARPQDGQATRWVREDRNRDNP